MPELPEVETIRRSLGVRVAGRSVVDAWSHESSKFTPAVEVIGATFSGADRRGKYLLLGLEDHRELVIHLGMTGQLHLAGGATSSRLDERDPYVRAEWTLDGGSDVLSFRDVRRFGRLRVVPSGDYRSITTLHQLGPEPLGTDFAPEAFHRALKASNRRIKTQLLSQKPVAGVGNIYADEALWQARIYPARRSITRAEAACLHEAVVDVLQRGVDNGGTTLRDYRTFEGGEGDNQNHLSCYGRAGLPCPRCAAQLQSRVWDARTTTFCPRCQPR